uniref:Uncharacterized protein n=1 Tax=Rhizophora mucronata TaxID=61149 RepID=A0A2P2QEJ6_RHIMU
MPETGPIGGLVLLEVDMPRMFKFILLWHSR